MTVLIAAASRHGSTREIAELIARKLRAAGLRVDEREPDEVDDVSSYAAAVIGSAVYMGRWLESARELAQRQEGQLAVMPVWLFSSGPLGDPLRPADEPGDAVHMAERVGARESRVFGGHLDRRDLRVSEKAIVRMVHAADGDYRPWDEIGAWADSIARAVTPVGRTSGL